MYGGTVLSATSVDANNGMYPIAIYICREGRMKEWEKFLAIIPPLLKDTKRAITFFTTSRMVRHWNLKSISYVYVFDASNVLECCPYRISEKALDAAKSYNRVYHEWNLINLSELQRRWVEACGKSSWARHSYDLSARCPQMVNIFSKAFNLWITELKCLPICQFIMGFEAKLIQLFLTRRRNGRLWKDERIVPRASAKLGDQILHKRLYHASSRPVWRNNFINLVTNICNKPSRNVNLLLRTCDYGKWQISGVPCVHDVAVIAQHRHRPPFYEKYVDEYFIVGKYMASYAGIIYQTPGMTESLQVAGINPPPLKNIIHLS
ncbi:uncharacterized protein LOC113360002 [Papaver somniferum]|uniref:uncharacterized protein LOC113360002 n=1 Tax=Papaver somniferum TaxID=3469 RepID=UPI000E70516D|nr:uncharacterized protein LOC113360002 [Papaver somniferum]